MEVERFSRYDLDKYGKRSFFAPTQHIKTIITLVLLGAESWLITLFKALMQPVSILGFENCQSFFPTTAHVRKVCRNARRTAMRDAHQFD